MRPLGSAKVLEARRRRGLSPGPRRPSAASTQVDPSKTRDARGGARRGRHRALDAGGVAPGKKNARRLGAHLVFVDESGILLIPSVHKTWAPRGQTPIIRHRYQRDKISVISGISVSPVRQRLGLYWRFLPKT